MRIGKALVRTLVAAAFASCAGHVAAQAPAPAAGPSYGAPVTIDQAKKAAAGAMAEARKNNWNMAVAVVDPHGALVYYERMEDTQTASYGVAIDKAKASAMYRRPTRAFEDAVNKGRPSVLALPGAMPIAGGLPIVINGKIAGAIGVSGATADQDEQCAKAGLDGMK
jgi:glc operon protein GlcG